MAPNLPGDASQPGMNMGFQGFEQYVVRILSVDSNGFATTIATKYNRYMPPISVNNMLGSGALPQTGELWMVNKINGAWTFSSRVEAQLPTVSAPTDLIASLAQLGIINGASEIVSDPSVVDSISALVSALAGLGFLSSQSQIPAAVVELSGVIKMWPTTQAPSGYLLLDGSTYAQSAYPALALVFGVTSGNFTLPDFRGRTPTGFLTGDSYFGTLLGTSGQENISLTVAQLAEHNHPDSGHNHIDAGHYHGNTSYELESHSHSASFSQNNVVYSPGSSIGGVSGGVWPITGVGNTGDLSLGTESASHVHSTNSGNASIDSGYANNSFSGTGSPISVVQPSIAINFIIKT